MVPVGGSNEHRVPGSKHHFITALNLAMQGAADGDGVDLVAAGQAAARDGLHAWHNPALYLKAKYEISPDAAPMYGELAARLVAARAGLSSKCLVLDLDDTLWGGVIGDDGPAGIVLGQGSARGEAFAAFQEHVRDLGRRGIILAVCSKNDESVARAAFRDHPEMVLREDDIACFVANWQDKPANLRAIARQLNIGLDSLVFADDNPFERSLVRRELPMVGVPELGTEPALYARTLADAGYFEAVTLTEEDAVRSRAYRENTLRDQARESATDMRSYLLGLDMRLKWRRFDDVGLQRIVQLINKTNQFNLTTQRTTLEITRQNMGDPGFIGLQLRLVDRFGDNGIIAIVAGRALPDGVFTIETWLMSCRVLGRRVEQATRQVLAGEAAGLGCTALAGLYRPSPRNGMVAGLYPSLQFETIATHPDGDVVYRLALPLSAPVIDIMTIEEAV